MKTYFNEINIISQIFKYLFLSVALEAESTNACDE